jgi:hypothetical protein
MTKANPQDGRRYDAETHQWVEVSADVLSAEKKDKPAPVSKPKPDHAPDTKE